MVDPINPSADAPSDCGAKLHVTLSDGGPINPSAESYRGNCDGLVVFRIPFCPYFCEVFVGLMGDRGFVILPN